MQYSAERRAFYAAGLTYTNMPGDLIEIEPEYHATLLAAQSVGAEIEPDINGVPQAVMPVALTAEETLNAWRATTKVSRFQAMAALHNAGLLDEAVEIVTQVGGLIKIAWDNAMEFRRNSPAILNLALALGLDEEELDALFIAAAEIEA